MWCIFLNSIYAKKLKERLKIHQPKMGVEPCDINVMELKNRWGSCTAKGVYSKIKGWHIKHKKKNIFMLYD